MKQAYRREAPVVSESKKLDHGKDEPDKTFFKELHLETTDMNTSSEFISKASTYR